MAGRKTRKRSEEKAGRKAERMREAGGRDQRGDQRLERGEVGIERGGDERRHAEVLAAGDHADRVRAGESEAARFDSHA